jgi:uncharacterized oxidoreductase
MRYAITQMHGNTIFITGGTSGIGRGLAEAFHGRGNQVIIAGRRESRLKEVCQQNQGMAHIVLDLTKPQAIINAANEVIEKFPQLNCVINNAAVQMHVEFGPAKLLDEEKLQTEMNPICSLRISIAAAFVPHLAKRVTTASPALLVNVSSGLAFVPMACYAIYCATKAALHSWTLSLRQQLCASGVQVLELIPPYVATELGGAGNPVVTSSGRGPMPLDAFIAETMKQFESGADELPIADAQRLVFATCPETVKKAFAAMNG